MTLLIKILSLLIASISLCDCLKCNGNCKCHGTIMDCSSMGIKKPFVKMEMLPSNVTTIDLKRNNISMLPSEYLMYTNEDIKEIKLWFNEIQKVQTSMLGKSFPCLVVLQLHQNKITHITSVDFIAVNRLRVLDLGENQIITIEKGSFARLKMLKELNLDGNRLQSLLPDSFAGLISLSVLKLNLNDLTILDGKWLHQMISLEELFAKSNKIRYIKPFNITWQKSLRKINLFDNQIQYLPNLPALENINAVNQAGEGWYMELGKNPVKCNCFMKSMANYIWQNLKKAVCGISIKCQLEGHLESEAQWALENRCNVSQRMRFVDKYLKMSECQEPQQRLRVSKIDVNKVTFTILQCVAAGSIVPNVKIKHLIDDTMISTQAAKNIAIYYVQSNESVSNFQCIAENNVGLVKSSEWIESKSNCSKKECSNKMNKTLHAKNQDFGMKRVIFPFTIFLICMAITVAICVAYILDVVIYKIWF